MIWHLNNHSPNKASKRACGPTMMQIVSTTRHHRCLNAMRLGLISSPGWQALMSNYNALLVTSFLAVWLSFAWDYVFQIAKYLAILVLRRFGNHQSVNERNILENQIRQPLLHTENYPLSVPNSVQDVLERSDGGRDLLKNTNRYLFQRHRPHKLVLSLTGLLFFALFVSWVILGIFLARIETDGAAKWASNRCGIWAFDSDEAGEDAATRADVSG